MSNLEKNDAPLHSIALPHGQKIEIWPEHVTTVFADGSLAVAKPNDGETVLYTLVHEALHTAVAHVLKGGPSSCLASPRKGWRKEDVPAHAWLEETLAYGMTDVMHDVARGWAYLALERQSKAEADIVSSLQDRLRAQDVRLDERDKALRGMHEAKRKLTDTVDRQNLEILTLNEKLGQSRGAPTEPARDKLIEDLRAQIERLTRENGEGVSEVEGLRATILRLSNEKLEGLRERKRLSGSKLGEARLIVERATQDGGGMRRLIGLEIIALLTIGDPDLTAEERDKAANALGRAMQEQRYRRDARKSKKGGAE